MKYHYRIGTIRWVRWRGRGDVRSYRAPEGWEASAHKLDHHPITDARECAATQWWIREEYVGHLSL